jgi:carboxylesterase type B
MLSQGLFHGAIIQSGSVLNPWSWMNRKFVENTAFELGSKLGCASNPTQEFLSCLRNKTTAEIVQAQGLLAVSLCPKHMRRTHVSEYVSKESFSLF